MTSQTGQQIITIHILPKISRSKGDHTMEFGQSVEYKMGNTFFEISYTKCGGEATLGAFYKKSKLCVSLDQQFEML